MALKIDAATFKELFRGSGIDAQKPVEGELKGLILVLPPRRVHLLEGSLCLLHA